MLRSDSWAKWNIRVNEGWGDVYEIVVYETVVNEGMVYEGAVYQISCFDIALENVRHRKIILVKTILCPKIEMLRKKPVLFH